jgi:branched-chain amino acid aminotransferase
VHGERTFSYGDRCGPILRSLYDNVTGIQYGEKEDKYGWMLEIE